MNTPPKQGKDQHLATIIENAHINWHQDHTPVSAQFDDVYYSTNNGLEETRYVFLEHNHLPERWQAIDDSAQIHFTIAETGFGTGLNFLAACELWHSSALENAHLHFVSVEKFPLAKTDLIQALAPWKELNEFAQALIERYPPLVTGYHRIDFPEFRIHLTLIFADAAAGFKQLQGSVDAWFLDGFAPSKNPDMWQPELFRQISRLSHQGTTLATFTAAGVVRRGLEDKGFEITKHKGFGHKREMISGVNTANNTIPPRLPHNQNPWYIEKHKTSQSQHITSAIVIGAGLAGTATARALAMRGIKVTVIEKHSSIAQEASGNPVGMTFTKLSPFDNAQNRFYQKAYSYSIDRIAERFQNTQLVAGKDYDLNGVIRFAYSEKESLEQQKLLKSGLWPDTMANALSPRECETLIGIPCKYGGLHLTKGGWLTPADLCEVNLSHPLIEVVLSKAVSAFTRRDNTWQILLDGKPLTADAIILANSFGAGMFADTQFLPLRSVRGQITYVPASEQSRQLKHALNYEGYITPAKNGFHCVGATFHPKENTPDFRQQDHQSNLSNLMETVPVFNQWLFDSKPTNNWPLTQGRVAFRCQSPDYLPMVGPIPCLEQFKHDYGNLRKGFLKKDFPLGSYLPNVYANVAHGSRGVTSSIFSAEIIAAYINNEPQPIDKEVIEAIHPARFAIRGLKRNQL